MNSYKVEKDMSAEELNQVLEDLTQDKDNCYVEDGFAYFPRLKTSKWAPYHESFSEQALMQANMEFIAYEFELGDSEIAFSKHGKHRDRVLAISLDTNEHSVEDIVFTLSIANDYSERIAINHYIGDALERMYDIEDERYTQVAFEFFGDLISYIEDEIGITLPDDYEDTLANMEVGLPDNTNLLFWAIQEQRNWGEDYISHEAVETIGERIILYYGKEMKDEFSL